MARNIKLLLAYDGTSYHGWERQRQFRSLQQTLEEAIQSLTSESVSVIASGRTDAGVHALGQVANFRSDTRHDVATIRRALNALLPDDLRVLEAEEVEESFHATYAAKGKLYRFAMHDGAVMVPFLRRYVCHCNWPLDDEAMRRAGECLVGTHDFSAFETAGAPRESSIRTITQVAVYRDGVDRLWSRGSGQESGVRGQKSDVSDQRSGDQRSAISNALSAVDSGVSSAHPQSAIRNAQFPLVFLEVAADGFLYNMVRAIAGTLINVGRRYWPAERVSQILESRDRTAAGPTAPPHGLFLVRVEY